MPAGSSDLLQFSGASRYPCLPVAADPSWLFAYGSLIWRPGFEFAERARGFVRGWSRRFWQGSTDHRGLPGAPGRVLTLAEDDAAVCWGVAYRLEPALRDATLRQLDLREQGGYERRLVEFHCCDGERAGSWPALVYVAAPDNPDYLGPAELEEIARQVKRAVGPSGTNLQYVLELHAVLRKLGIDDPHIAELASLLLRPSAATSIQAEASGAQAEAHAQPRRAV
jgi:cation transport regulator ChaC